MNKTGEGFQRVQGGDREQRLLRITQQRCFKSLSRMGPSRKRISDYVCLATSMTLFGDFEDGAS